MEWGTYSYIHTSYSTTSDKEKKEGVGYTDSSSIVFCVHVEYLLSNVTVLTYVCTYHEVSTYILYVYT